VKRASGRNEAAEEHRMIDIFEALIELIGDAIYHGFARVTGRTTEPDGHETCGEGFAEQSCS
jgi:hypothetical protein